MADAGGPLTSINTKVYFDKALPAQPAPTWAQLAGNNLLVSEGNRVDDVTDIGDVDQQGNPIEFIPYGYDTTKKAAGAARLADFTLTFVVNHADAVHKEIVSSSIGDDARVAVVSRTADAAQTAYFLRGEILGINRQYDTGDVDKVTLSIAFDQKPLVVAQA